MKKRKHRVVVDVSFDGPVAESYAVKAMQLVLDSADKEAILRYLPREIIKAEAKEGQRVLQQEVRKALEVRRLSPFAGYRAAPIISDDDAYLLEAAHQAGAVFLNDDATIYAYRQDDLLRLIRCALAKDFAPLWDKGVAK